MAMLFEELSIFEDDEFCEKFFSPLEQPTSSSVKDIDHDDTSRTETDQVVLSLCDKLKFL